MKNKKIIKKKLMFLILLIILLKTKSELNHLRLHKIIYFSHISSLIKRKKPLINERLETWLYGPVFRILYRYIKENNNGFIVNVSNKGYCQKLNQE